MHIYIYMLLYILYAHPNFTNPANWDNTRHSRLDQSRGAIVGPVHLGQRLSQCILLWCPTGHHYGPFSRTDQIHGGGNLVLARLALGKIQEHYGHWQCGTRESPPQKKQGLLTLGFNENISHIIILSHLKFPIMDLYGWWYPTRRQKNGWKNYTKLSQWISKYLDWWIFIHQKMLKQ